MENDETLPKGKPVSDDDTEGHSLLTDTDYGQRRHGRLAEAEREMRLRRQAKETRPNRPDRG